MFLKSIDLFGFKSFADRTHIEFTDGISALIGPNGCGKSNVVDAVKWVLGEQATKSLRAERMEDVIFNGTDSRKPVNVAEVSLTLDNDGVLPLDVPEIAVRRRLFRSGESEYFVNGAPVKLKELRELFYDTGIGKSAYSIMEQGKIDQILSNKPEDRRSLFEEAAGITRYKMRGREADRKLERTESNMKEVDSVLVEVKRAHDTLKRQSEKTSRYRELKDQQFSLEVSLQRARLRAVTQHMGDAEGRVQALEQKRTKLRAQIDDLNERLEADLDRVNGMESELVERQKQLYGLGVEKTARQDRSQLLKEQQGQLVERLERETRQLMALDERAEEIMALAAQARSDAEDAESSVREADQTIVAVDERIGRARDRQEEARSTIRRHESDIADREKLTANAQRELRQVTDELVDALDSELRASGYSTAERNRTEDEVLRALEQLRITVEGRRDYLSDQLVLGKNEQPADTVGEAFQTIAAAIDGVREASLAFAAAMPRFLDDFLAPECTITRKRTLDESIEAHGDAVRRLREHIRSLSEEIEHLGHTIEKERATREQLRLNRVKLAARAEALLEQARRHDLDLKDNRRRHQDSEQRIASDSDRKDKIMSQIERLAAEYSELSKREETLHSDIQRLEGDISKDNKALKNEEQRLKQAMQQLAQAQERMETAHVKVAERRTEIRGIYDSFAERHGRDLREFDSADQDGAPNENGEPDQRVLREQIAGVKAELKELGSVNLMAVEEFAEVSERYEFLNDQLEDLRKARNDLAQVTAEIKRESEQLFVDTYNRIRKNFHTVFRRLFGGGRAELRLTEADAILDSGIDILVQPPGKKLESIALLSGGERSLTAVALLFATFMVRPSPFTLLDEIDAALDEHNVGRFVNMLHEFGEQSQFIVITHNKKTVAGASTLLGVTMQENGVSQAVAVKIDGQTEDAPT